MNKFNKLLIQVKTIELIFQLLGTTVNLIL